jgi:hypothetical protein
MYSHLVNHSSNRSLVDLPTGSQEFLDKMTKLMSDSYRLWFQMRRALASLLLALFSFPLIVPMVREDAAASLPSCCRREGKHRCAMGSLGADTATSAVSPIPEKCPYYPTTLAVPGDGSVAFLNDSQTICISLVSYPAIEARTEARVRVSFIRTRQKRGPPALLS